MKRDMDLVRAILLAIEVSDTDPLEWVELNIPRTTELQISYHLKLMHVAGLIDATDVSSLSGLGYRAQALTSMGHDFLDCIRNDSAWKKFKAAFRSKAPQFVSDTLLDLAQRAIDT